MPHQIPKELFGGYYECALLWVELHLVLPKKIEGFAQILEMIHTLHTFYNTSSTYTSMMFPMRSLKTLFMIRWKVAPSLLSLNGITL